MDSVVRSPRRSALVRARSMYTLWVGQSGSHGGELGMELSCLLRSGRKWVEEVR